MSSFPHCPNPDCTLFHHDLHNRTDWLYRHGYYFNNRTGYTTRFKCRSCGRTFCENTFCIDYYAKKRIDYTLLMQQLVTGSGLWDITRLIGVSVDVIQNRFERLARCLIGIHADILERLSFDEDVALDGFESFSASQYYPNNINIIAGSDSQFLYGLGLAVLRRKGRMTSQQRLRRTALEKHAKADSNATKTSIFELLGGLLGTLQTTGRDSLCVHTDEHHSYPPAIRRARGKSGQSIQVVHNRMSSKAARTRRNPLFPVNYCDRQFRKDLSDHARETVQFARCPSAMMSRMAVYQFYHNCVLPARNRMYRKGDQRTRAEMAGIKKHRLKHIIDHRFLKRVFLRKTRLDSQARKTWMMEWENPGIPMKRYRPLFIMA